MKTAVDRLPLSDRNSRPSPRQRTAVSLSQSSMPVSPPPRPLCARAVDLRVAEDAGPAPRAIVESAQIHIAPSL